LKIIISFIPWVRNSNINKTSKNSLVAVKILIAKIPLGKKKEEIYSEHLKKDIED
jgi:hypothetical protein